MTDVERAVAFLVQKRKVVDPRLSLLAAVSGIDGSGKGYITGQLTASLSRGGARVANINIDGRLNLPAQRFSASEPAEHFYRNAIRFSAMFDQLVLPLKAQRRHCVVTDFAEETATAYRPHRYQFDDVDVILLEGIFLLKREYRAYFDVTLWVDCSFRTALERALRRGQEGLPPDETIRAYETIYFPAQRIHFARDEPRGAADLVIVNDSRLTGAGQSAGGPPP